MALTKIQQRKAAAAEAAKVAELQTTEFENVFPEMTVTVEEFQEIEATAAPRVLFNHKTGNYFFTYSQGNKTGPLSKKLSETLLARQEDPSIEIGTIMLSKYIVEATERNPEGEMWMIRTDSDSVTDIGLFD